MLKHVVNTKGLMSGYTLSAHGSPPGVLWDRLRGVMQSNRKPDQARRKTIQLSTTTYMDINQRLYCLKAFFDHFIIYIHDLISILLIKDRSRGI